MKLIRRHLEKCKQKKKGFTLIELIVVIAIIGILAAIMLPRYFGFTDQARINAAISDAKNIRSIAEAYYAQNNVWPTIKDGGGSVAVPGTSGTSGTSATNGTDTSTLTAPSGSDGTGSSYPTINSPAFPGQISAYSTTAATKPSALASFPVDGSFNYTSNTGHVVSCDGNGTVTDIN